MRAGGRSARLAGMLRITLLLIGAGAFYATRLRRPILTWGATAEEATAGLPGDELLEPSRRHRHARDHRRRAGHRRVAVDRPDGPGAARRRVHV